MTIKPQTDPRYPNFDNVVEGIKEARQPHPGLSIGERHLSGQHKPYPDPPKMNGREMLVEIQFYREDAGGTLQTDAIRVIASDNATAIKRALTAAAGKPYYRRIIGARVTD